MHELSYQNIIKKLIQFESLKIGVLSDKQLQVFENLPRIYPTNKMDIKKELKLDASYFDDPLIIKLLSPFNNINKNKLKY